MSEARALCGLQRLHMFRIYLLIFWIPTIASAFMLLTTWRSGLVARPGRLFIWFIVALTLQFAAGLFSPAWAIGLALQSILAVYLAIQLKLG